MDAFEWALNEGRYERSPVSGFHAGLRHMILRLCERRGLAPSEGDWGRLNRCRDVEALEALFDAVDAGCMRDDLERAFAALPLSLPPVAAPEPSDPDPTAPGRAPSPPEKDR